MAILNFQAAAASDGLPEEALSIFEDAPRAPRRLLGCAAELRTPQAIPGPSGSTGCRLEVVVHLGRSPALFWGRSAVPMGAPSTSTIAAEPSVPSTGGPRVVVIDHRHDRRQLMGHVVALGGDDVVVVGYAEDPAGAVEAVDRLGADAVVLEIQLPVARGLETIAALRRDHPALRILVCTFHDDEVTRSAALSAGADNYLIKPLSPRDIYPLLRPVQVPASSLAAHS